jgi:ribosomal protein S27AE
MHAELPYDDTRDQGWEAAVDELAWVRTGEETVTKRGPCPRCGHAVAFVHEARPSENRAADERGVFEECNCGVRHPGTPAGRIGCGAHGLIRRAQGAAQDRA